MLGILGAVLGPIGNIIMTWLNGKQDLAKAKVETELAREANNARLMSDTLQYNSAWEQAQLLDSDKWVRRICFAIFSFPFIFAWFDPISVTHYFNVVIAQLPTWYIQTYMGIVGAVWGISALKNPITQLFSSSSTQTAVDTTTTENPDA